MIWNCETMRPHWVDAFQLVVVSVDNAQYDRRLHRVCLVVGTPNQLILDTMQRCGYSKALLPKT